MIQNQEAEALAEAAVAAEADHGPPLMRPLSANSKIYHLVYRIINYIFRSLFLIFTN